MGKTDTLLTMADLGIDPGDPVFQDLVQIFQDQCRSLKALQTSGGGWRNVVTSNDAFVETSATSMILYSVVNGVRRRWLDADEFDDVIEKAWMFVADAVEADGTVRDVITGTAVQLNEKSYDRSRDYEKSGPGLGSVLRAVAAYALYLNK